MFYSDDLGHPDHAEPSIDKTDYAFGQPANRTDNLRCCQGDSERECLGFSEFVNLSNTSLVSSPRLSASGQNVFVVWEEGKGGKSNIIYKHSNDSGATFGPAVSISSDSIKGIIANDAIQPDVSSFANNVYVVWKSQQSGIQLKHSNDSGTTFGPPITLTNNNTNISDLKLAASEDNVYVVWKSDGFSFQKFSNHQASFDKQVNFDIFTGRNINLWASNNIDSAAIGDRLLSVWIQPALLSSEIDSQYFNIYYAGFDTKTALSDSYTK